VTRRIEGAGTSEDDWLGWPNLAALPPLELVAPPRVVIVAPHPDDEVLGAGGTAALLEALGSRIVVLALTDGEASHPVEDVDPTVLAHRRSGETEEALCRLLRDEPTVRRLGLPDGDVGSRVETVAAALEDALGPGDWCLAPHHHDGHPDHEAASAAAATACAGSGAHLVEYPVWLWHWSAPGDPGVDWSRARRVDLPPDVRARKRAAIAAFTSQVAPLGGDGGDGAGRTILPPAVLARFERPWEVLFP